MKAKFVSAENKLTLANSNQKERNNYKAYLT